jgi:hypothetical protein
MKRMILAALAVAGLALSGSAQSPQNQAPAAVVGFRPAPSLPLITIITPSITTRNTTLNSTRPRRRWRGN